MLIGIIFVSANFISPHTVKVEKSVQVLHILPMSSEHTLASTRNAALYDNNYLNFPAANISEKETLKVTWLSSSDNLEAYILTGDQFDEFQGQIITYQNYTGGYEAKAVGGENGASLEFNVSKSGDYLAVLYSAKPSIVAYFNESTLFYNYPTYITETRLVPQNDNLYLFVGIGFLIIGAVCLLVFRRHRKTTNLKQ